MEAQGIKKKKKDFPKFPIAAVKNQPQIQLPKMT